MWKYNRTEDMFKHSDDELYHSDVYLGQDFSDGLMHFKYIKREMKNGRWVYYYDNSSLKNAENNYNNKASKATSASVRAFNSKQNLRTAKRESKENREYYDYKARDAREKNHEYFDKLIGTKNTLSNKKKIASYTKKMNSAYDKAEEYENKVNKLDKNLSKAKKEYSKNNKAADKEWKKADKANKKLTKEQISSATIGNATKVAVKGLNAASSAKQKISKSIAKLTKKKKKK